jgi:hypothetical protein
LILCNNKRIWTARIVQLGDSETGKFVAAVGKSELVKGVKAGVVGSRRFYLAIICQGWEIRTKLLTIIPPIELPLVG